MTKYNNASYVAMNLARDLAKDEVERNHPERSDGGYFANQVVRGMCDLMESFPYDLPDLRTPLERDADEEAEAARMSADALDGGDTCPSPILMT